jgi:hypothetical protein
MRPIEVKVGYMVLLPQKKRYKESRQWKATSEERKMKNLRAKQNLEEPNSGNAKIT